MYAVEEDNKQAFDILLDYKAVPRVPEEYMLNRGSLEHAIRNQKVEAIEMILNSGFDINSGDFLFCAAQAGLIDMVTLLLDKGADINKVNNYAYRSPIMAAAQYGKKDIVELLIKRGANLDIQDEYGDTALHLSSKSFNKCDDIVKMLILADADVNKINKEQETFLMMVIKNNSEEIAEMVIERTKDVNLKDKYESTAIALAIKKGKYRIVKLLIDKIESIEGCAYLNYLLELAIYHGHLEIVDLILSKNIEKNHNFENLLNNAALSDSVEMVEKILKICKEEHSLEKYGPKVLLNALEFTRAMNTSKFLIEKGVDINFVSKENKSALSILLYNQILDESEMINLLIEKGVDVSKTIQNKESALNVAIGKGYSKLVNLLLEIEFNPRNSISLLQKVISFSNNVEILLLLIKKGADIKLVGEDYLKTEREPIRGVLEKLLYIDKKASSNETLADISLNKIKKNNFANQTKETMLDVFRVFHSNFSISEIIKIIGMFKLKEEDLLKSKKESDCETKDNQILEKLRDFCDFCKVDIDLLFDE